jgi:hypothetical protein
VENKSNISQVIKTDDFFIGKKTDKEIHIQNKCFREFNNICASISKSERAEKQREDRREKRKRHKFL